MADENRIKLILEAQTDRAEAALAQFRQSLEGAFESGPDAASQTGSSIEDAFVSAAGEVSSAMQDMADTIADSTSSAEGSAEEAGESIDSSITSGAEAAAAAVDSMAECASDALDKVKSGAEETGSSFITTAGDMKNALSDFQGQISGVIDGMRDAGDKGDALGDRLSAAFGAGVDADKLRDDLVELSSLSQYSTDQFIDAAVALNKFGKYSVDTLKMLNDAGMATGVGLSGLARAYAFVTDGGENTTRGLLMFSRQLNISKEDLIAYGAVVNENGEFMANNAEQAEAAKKALDTILLERYAGAQARIIDNTDLLNKDLEEFALKVGDADFAIRQAVAGAMLPLTGVLNDLSDGTIQAGAVVTSVTGNLVDFGIGALDTTANVGILLKTLPEIKTAAVAMGTKIASAWTGLAGLAAQASAGAATLGISLGALAAPIAIIAAAAAGFALLTKEIENATKAEEELLAVELQRLKWGRENKDLIGKTAEQVLALGKTEKDVAHAILALQQQAEAARATGNDAKVKEIEREIDGLQKVKAQLSEATVARKEEADAAKKAAEEKAAAAKKAAEVEDRIALDLIEMKQGAWKADLERLRRERDEMDKVVQDKAALAEWYAAKRKAIIDKHEEEVAAKTKAAAEKGAVSVEKSEGRKVKASEDSSKKRVEAERKAEEAAKRAAEAAAKNAEDMSRLEDEAARIKMSDTEDAIAAKEKEVEAGKAGVQELIALYASLHAQRLAALEKETAEALDAAKKRGASEEVIAKIQEVAAAKRARLERKDAAETKSAIESLSEKSKDAAASVDEVSDSLDNAAKKASNLGQIYDSVADAFADMSVNDIRIDVDKLNENSMLGSKSSSGNGDDRGKTGTEDKSNAHKTKEKAEPVAGSKTSSAKEATAGIGGAPDVMNGILDKVTTIAQAAPQVVTLLGQIASSSSTSASSSRSSSALGMQTGSIPGL